MSPAEIEEALQAGRRLAASTYSGDWGNGLVILDGVPGDEAETLRRQLRTQYARAARDRDEARSRTTARRTTIASVLMELVAELEDKMDTLSVTKDVSLGAWGASEIQKARTEISSAAVRLRAVAALLMGNRGNKDT